MAINSFLVPEDCRPPWVLEDFSVWYEVVCDTWVDYLHLVSVLSQATHGVDIHQATPFQDFPRVFYVGYEKKEDTLYYTLSVKPQDNGLEEL